MSQPGTWGRLMSARSRWVVGRDDARVPLPLRLCARRQQQLGKQLAAVEDQIEKKITEEKAAVASAVAAGVRRMRCADRAGCTLRFAGTSDDVL
jgi:hypothetical protein